MTIPDLVKSLRSRGVTLRAEGDRLRVDAPAGVLTPADRETLAVRKPELLDHFTRLAVWRLARQYGFPTVGRDDWASFCVTGPIDGVRDVLAEATGAVDPHDQVEREA